MAKVILEQKLKALGKLPEFEIDSAAYDGPTFNGASSHAKEALKKLFGSDLLASHKAKKITPELADQADLILVMEARMKKGLPPGKTWMLKEYAGGSGDVVDPFSGGLDNYLLCARELSVELELIVSKSE